MQIKVYKPIQFVFSCLYLISCGEDYPVTQEQKTSHTFNIPNQKAIYGQNPLKCENGTALTWGSFGQFFFDKYCTSCHSINLQISSRGGTPLTSNFDTYQDIALARSSILKVAGKKLGSTMPPSDIVPRDERNALIEYLNCGAPP